MYPVYIGCTARWKWHSTPVRSAHVKMALLVSSLPLRPMIIFGLPRSTISRSTSRGTWEPERDVAANRGQILQGAIIDDGRDAEATATRELIHRLVMRLG
jgi:hypothetical protein